MLWSEDLPGIEEEGGPVGPSAMALRCFRLVGPKYALTLLLLEHKKCGKSCVCSRPCNDNDDSIAPNLILVEIT